MVPSSDRPGDRLRRVPTLVGMLAVTILVLSLAACGGTGQPNTPDTGAEIDPAEYYQDQTITLVVAYEAGSGQDLEARLIADHIGRYIPGQPEIEVQNMPGAGGLRAVQYIYEAAPDGLTIGFFGGSPPVEQLMSQYTDVETVLNFDVTEIEWIGSTGGNTGVFWVNPNGGITSIDDLRALQEPLRAGATRPGSTTFALVSLVSEVLDVPMDIVTGYQGGSDLNLALFREEIYARAGDWRGFLTAQEGFGDAVLPLIILGDDISDEQMQAEAGVTGIPNITELTDSPDMQALIRVGLSSLMWGRLIGAPPGTPPELVAALRDALAALADDEEFLADNERRNTDVRPTHGSDIEQLIMDYLDTPGEVIQRFLTMMEES